MSNDARRTVRSVLMAAGPLACAVFLLAGAAAAQQPVRVDVSHEVDLDVPRSVAGSSVRARGSRPASAVLRRQAGRASREAASRSLLEGVILSLTSRRSPAAAGELGSLSDVLPAQLCRDLVRLRAQVKDARRVLFGQRGIVRIGRLDAEGEDARMRLNLQHSPDPGIRVTLVTP